MEHCLEVMGRLPLIVYNAIQQLKKYPECDFVVVFGDGKMMLICLNWRMKVMQWKMRMKN